MYVVYKETSEGLSVETLYFNPTPKQMEALGIEIEGEMPQPINISGMVPVLKVDVKKAQLFYDYEKPDTIENRVQDLQKENENLKKENAALLLQVAGIDSSSQQLTQDHATLLLQLAEKGVI
ncbi:hypothetical protein M5X00_17765 [Paenibacillus alvei]|uniref:hypothetical protein n=1 Tax=Paenibacillus alvei TaxID=44250 RepID=UPI000288B201|nr:hypothetical protein [Paenibacillus alvei]EJW16891.1 hypothetical protein PAV_5c04740 [Paenibacillus alvei DSM 29]EJW19888.1 hypothetical protein PAV_1c08760 [Paenibacillus alvei DSM 29]MCY9543288.1 hypothetical protein [Paenibacillus alvei]MCY9708455.1 hypothetical protein [Paenibacillus alvei]MCY9732178.1 hypothetical protein [Paenibacillus alvei]